MVSKSFIVKLIRIVIRVNVNVYVNVGVNIFLKGFVMMLIKFLNFINL